ncbi:MAG: aminoglycoside phosphotransferase family protein [Bacteroidales bacterium]|jgi:thiamine kinase-like enzyme|nr:aminoglycoside phosphotransferase family protein [Bacteroidales bacterium]
MDHNLKKIFELFVSEGTFHKAEPFGSGHIHETFLVKTAEPDKDDYILQKINNTVFRNIPELQENVERVTIHLQKKISAIPGSDIKRECLQMMPARNGKSWSVDGQGNYWRIFVFISNHRSYDIVDSPAKAFEGGKAIGRFQALLADLPGKPLHETIPSFHDVEKRIDSFLSTLKNDPYGRVRETVKENDFILRRADDMKIIQKLGREGKIPVRITHNDTKFNNILFDENDRSLCIIDLDTVMLGYFHSDFGDAIRTGANIAAEDEKELQKIKMDISLFGAYAEGYLSETRNTLNTVEKEYLAFAPLLMTYEQALRFLTDYLDGDKYYRIHFEKHNLQRTRAQIRLLESMEEQYKEMKEIIKKVV